MFKKGDYIVCLPEPNKDPIGIGASGGAGFLANYIYKISKVSSYDFCFVLWTRHNGRGIYDNSVRYAIEEEIEEYDRLGKPFNVIEFNNFTLPKNWHIVVTEENAEDVLKWRFEKDYNEKDKLDFLNNIVGISKREFNYSKEHNPKTNIIGDTYDFGIEITYTQFKKYVLNKEINNNFLIKFLDKYGIK